MPFRAEQVTVSSTPTLVFQAQPGDVEVTLSGDTNDAIHVGGTDSVTVSTGLRIFGAGDRYTTLVRAGDELWAVVSGSSKTVNYLARSI